MDSTRQLGCLETQMISQSRSLINALRLCDINTSGAMGSVVLNKYISGITIAMLIPFSTGRQEEASYMNHLVLLYCSCLADTEILPLRPRTHITSFFPQVFKT